MKSARLVLKTFVPTLALVATATVGILTQVPQSDAAPQPRSTAVKAAAKAPVTYAAGSPVGHLDKLTRVPGGVRATGWTYDPSVPTGAVQVFASIDGAWKNTTTANRSRPDIGRAYPQAGSLHGYDFTIPVTEGSHIVCVLAKNTGAGQVVTFGCLPRQTFAYGPFGTVEKVDTRPGRLHVSGWLLDGDAPAAPVSAKVTIDGAAHTVVADKSRPTVAAKYPTAGAAHGFDVVFTATQGVHTVCITAVNIGFGADKSFGCRDVTLNDNPVGAFALEQKAGKLRVVGWAFDRDDLSKAVAVTIKVGSTTLGPYPSSLVRNDVARVHNVPANRGFDGLFSAADGTTTVCVTARNVGIGADDSIGCRTITLDYRPKAAITSLAATRTGLTFGGWAYDPDTSAKIPVRLTLDGRSLGSQTANKAGSIRTGYNFGLAAPATSGQRTVCAVGVNQVSGTRDSVSACRTITLALSPLGGMNSVTRSGTGLKVIGWAYDPDTAAAATVAMTVDGKPAGSYRATAPRADVPRVYPSAGGTRGFAPVLQADAGKHTVCAVAKNVGGGQDVSFGCKIIFAVNPVAPSAPRSVTAVGGYGTVTVSWTPPASDGGATVSHYKVVLNPGAITRTVSGTTLSATIGGLGTARTYRASVQSVNLAGTSLITFSPFVNTSSAPKPQTTPAPVSVSRYVRNIRTCSTAESAEMQSFGRSDAARNVSGHRYLMLLDIGGQNQRYGGVVLSATTRFVTYAALLSCSKAYVDGYASAIKPTAPATIGIGVNNDMDVNATTGRDWATKIVNPLVSYAAKYDTITIAGANDIEPGFSGSYAATRNWVSGYLAATKAKFIFNGSADGCAWTVTNRSCNNGWSMSGLYNLAAGMAPTQMINLPQIYNYTMADQWKYISLTGIGQGKPRIAFGGPLTEVTACAQARSCDSISGRSAWQRLWNNLQSNSALRVSSLPYATDLRIDS